MSRHFIWLIPVANLAFSWARPARVRAGPGWPRGRPLVLNRVLCALTCCRPPGRLSADLRPGLVGGRAGVATRLVPLFERHRRRSAGSYGQFPDRPGVVAILGASPWVVDRIKQSRENARPLPPPGSPNVL